jgi:uncharacterized membrane protein
MVDLVRESGVSLERVLNDILDLARVESGRLEIEATPFRLSDLISGTSALFAVRADNKGLKFSQPCLESDSTWLVGDAVRIRQILANFLANAIKFTADGSVKLAVDMVPDQNSEGQAMRLIIAVSDTGPGIEPQDLARLFNRFEQIDASITRAVVLYADAILSPEAVPSAWPGPTLRSDGRSAARTTFTVERWKQRLVQGLALGLASPALRAVYAEAIMAICRGWRTVYVTKPSGDPVVPRPVTASQAGASAVGVVTAGVNTVTNYLHGQSQEQLAQTVYGIGSTALDQRAAQSVNTAESQALLAVAAARLANAARAEQAALAASTPQASSSEPTKSNAGAIVAGVIGVGAIGGLAWWYFKKRKK